MTKEEIFGFLKEQYCVGDKKAQIAYEIACREKALLDQLDCKNGYSCMQEFRSVQASAPTAHSALHQSLSGKIRSIVTLTQ